MSTEKLSELSKPVAETVINEHCRLVVEEDVWEQVMSALERPLAPTESISNAFKRYNSEESWSCN